MIPGLTRGKKFSTTNRRGIGGTLRIEAAEDPKKLIRNYSKGPPKRYLNLGGNIFGPQSPKRRPATAGGRLFRFF